MAILLLAGLTACRKENLSQPSPISGRMAITVCAEEAKAVLADGSSEGTKVAAFSAGDNISVFANGRNNKFTTEEGGKEAIFIGEAEDTDDYYYVVSPYAKASSINSDNKITINIPQEQKATKGSFDPKAMISAGRFKKGETPVLKNVLSLIKVTVPAGVRYKKIELACAAKDTDNNIYNQSISGEILVDANGNMSVSSDADKRFTSISLIPAKGETTIGPGDYYIATRPGTYRITIGYVTEDDHFFIRRSSQNNTLERSHIASAGELSAANYTDITAAASLNTGDAVNIALKKLVNSAVSAVTTDDNTITSVIVKPFSLGGIVGTYRNVNASSSAHPVYARLTGTEVTLYTPGSKLVLNENSIALFRNFKALKNLDFSAFSTEKVKNMTRFFAQSGFETLDLSSLKGDNVTSMQYICENCPALKEVDLRNFSGKSLTDFSFAFNGCSALEKVNLESAHTEKVSNFKAFLSGCQSVKEIKLGYYFNLNGITDAANVNTMFYNCPKSPVVADIYCSQEFHQAVSSTYLAKTNFIAARFNVHTLTSGIDFLSDPEISLIRGRKAAAKFRVIPLDLENVEITISESPYFTSEVEKGENPGEYTVTFEDSSTATEYSESVRITASFTENGAAGSSALDITVRSSDVNKINSGLPIVLVETPDKVEITDKENWIEGATLTILNPDFSLSYEGPMSVKGRGNNTWQFEKKPYAIKLEKKSEILGMKSHKRWCLLANYVDRTLMRNEVAFEISRRTSLAYTPSGKFVECFVNGVHRGNYYLCEQIKVDKNRVNIAELEDGEVDGGYIFEFDSYYDEMFKFRTARKNLPAQFKDPDEVNEAQFAYMKDYINNMEEALYDDARFSSREFADYMDLQSYADFFLIIELTQNLDLCTPKSHYMHKDKGGKMTAGPVWDFDYGTFKKNPLLPSREGYNFMATSKSQGHYFGRLMDDTEFKKLVKARWLAIRGDLATIPDFIDRTADHIRKSEAVNHAMWPIDNRDIAHDERMSFDDAVKTLKEAYQGKYDFLNDNISKWYQ